MEMNWFVKCKMNETTKKKSQDFNEKLPLVRKGQMEMKNKNKNSVAWGEKNNTHTETYNQTHKQLLTTIHSTLTHMDEINE